MVSSSNLSCAIWAFASFSGWSLGWFGDHLPYVVMVWFLFFNWLLCCLVCVLRWMCCLLFFFCFGYDFCNLLAVFCIYFSALAVLNLVCYWTSFLASVAPHLSHLVFSIYSLPSIHFWLLIGHLTIIIKSDALIILLR